MPSFCALLLPIIFSRTAADNCFVWPPETSNTLYIPQGSPTTLSWTSDFDFLNLRAFQQRSDGSFSWEDILSNVSNTPGPGSYAWAAGTNAELPSSDIMHFEITRASNGQSLNPFNSGMFFISNGSSISTSSSSSSTHSTTTSASLTTTSPARNPVLASSAFITSSSSAIPTSPLLPSADTGKDDTRKLGLGLGLGLGIPLLLIALSLAIFAISRRKTGQWSQRQRQGMIGLSEISPTYYDDEYRRPEIYEVDGHAAVFEAPSDITHEVQGSEVRHELNAGADNNSSSAFFPGRNGKSRR